MLFTTFTISVIILIFYNNNPLEKIKLNILRTLNNIHGKEDIFSPKYEKLEMKNITLASMYVLLGDYYSLIKKKSFLNNVNDIFFI